MIGFITPHLTGSIAPQLTGSIAPQLTFTINVPLACAKRSSKSQLMLPHNYYAHCQNASFSVPCNHFTFVY
jgi:hypothetical protein